MTKKHECTIGLGSFCPVCGNQLQRSGHCVECDTDPEYSLDCYQRGDKVWLEIPDALAEAYCNI